MKRKSIFAAIAVAMAMTTAGAAFAEDLNYKFTIELPGGNPVENLFLYAKGAGQEDLFVSPITLSTSGGHSLTQVTSFEVTQALIIGTNVSDIDHIIMFTNDDYALASVGYKWSEMFPQANGNPRHSVMFSTLNAAHDGDAAALATVTNFFHGTDAAEAMFDPHGSYSVIAYSVTPPPIGQDTPEPASLGILGLGALALCGRRRK